VYIVDCDPAHAVITALFWDPFDAARATAALTKNGFSEWEIEEIGVVCGRAPDLTDSLLSLGIARDQAILYGDCFADGGMLLIVRPELRGRAGIALKTLARHGGINLSANIRANHA